MKLIYCYLCIFIICISSIVFSSCSNKLDRVKAKALIIQSFELPYTIAEKLQYGEIYYSGDFGGGDITKENILQQQKLITFDFQGNRRGDLFFKGDQGRSYSVYQLELTSEGDKYRVDEGTDNKGRKFWFVKVADLVFGEVTGIREIEEGKLVEVEYTCQYSGLTPFGKAYNLIYQQRDPSGYSLDKRNPYYENQPIPAKLIFAKYDDGWRITDGTGPPTRNRIENPKKYEPVAKPDTHPNDNQEQAEKISSNQSAENNCGVAIKVGSEQGFITGQGVRMRSTPDISDDANIILKLNKDQLVLILEQKTDANNEIWYKVCYENQAGWVSGKYIEISVVENESE